MNKRCLPCIASLPFGSTVRQQTYPALQPGTGSLNEVWVDKQDILEQLHISPRTLQTWRSEGVLPFSRLGKKIYYNQHDVNNMLLKHRKRLTATNG
ncbi:MAG TPA: helix-turn-helix domain-containing protein [Segetibacter sp.]|jgi:hypothetical protein